MIGIIVLGLVAAFLIVFSIRERMRLKLYRKDWDAIGQTKASPFSESLAGLVGTAGGIYLSLVTLTTFLEMDIPNKVSISSISLEPMAALSFLLAVFSPFVNRIVIRIKKVLG